MIEKILSISFKNKDLIAQALTHPSLSRKGSDYERMEFLGDHVLGLVIAEELYHRFHNENEGQNAPSEINVIGFNVDDATRAVEKFVDHAFLAGLPRVRVVHGSGMGILRKALRQALQLHPHVESVAEPPQNEGGGGATVVELRL